MKNQQSGFIALISAIIISVLLLTITVGISMTGLWGRFNILDTESKERSSNLAEACVDTAILKLAQDSSYNKNAINTDETINYSNADKIPVNPDYCYIIFAQSNTIKTQAFINKAYTNLVVVIDSDYSIVSWNEVSNF